MAGFTPNEGEDVIANLVFINADADRGSSLELGLFTDSSPGESLTEATISEPMGTGYTRIPLTDASWSMTSGVASYAQQTFTGGAGGWAGSVYGYFIATTGTTPRLLAVEVDASGPYTIASADTYKITPNITIS